MRGRRGALGYVFLAREGLALAALTQSSVDEEKLGWEARAGRAGSGPQERAERHGAQAAALRLVEDRGQGGERLPP